MKFFSNIKLASSIREISNVLEIISLIVKIFSFLLIVLQGVKLISQMKKDLN